MFNSKFFKKKRGIDGKFIKNDDMSTDLSYEYKKNDGDMDDYLYEPITLFDRIKNFVFLLALLWLVVFAFTYFKKTKTLDKLVGLYEDVFECPICPIVEQLKCNVTGLYNKTDPLL